MYSRHAKVRFAGALASMPNQGTASGYAEKSENYRSF
jgi:hypothetical protein